MNSWYVIQVMAGSESDVVRRLRKCGGLQSAVPTRIVPELSNGKWRTRERVIMPGYVFIIAEMSAELYYAAINTLGVIRFLGTSAPEPLPPPDVQLLELLINDHKPIADSSAFRSFIVRRETRRRRDVISIELLGKRHTIELMQRESSAGDSSPAVEARTYGGGASAPRVR